MKIPTLFSHWFKVLCRALAFYMVLFFGVAYAAESNTLSLSLEIAEPHTFGEAYLDTDQLTAGVTMTVRSQDSGKDADLFLVALHEENWYQRTIFGWREWDGDPFSLARMGSAQLGSNIEFSLFSDDLLLAGDYEVWAAYQVEGEELQVSSSSASFTVHSSKQDTLHVFRSDAAMEAYLKQGMLEGASSDFNRVALQTFAVAESTDSSAGGSAQVSATNVQEVGVDEADTVKTDGEFLYVLRNCGFENCIATFELDATTPAAEEVGLYEPPTEVNEFPSATNSMYLIQDSPSGNDMIVTLSGFNPYIAWLDFWGWGSNEVELEFLDASDPADLSLTERMVIDGTLISSRRVGDQLYIVTRYSPGFEGFIPYAFTEESRQSNSAALETATLSTLLPKVEMPNVDPRDLIESKDCYIATNSLNENRNPSIITVTTIPLGDPSDFDSTCFLGNTETVYMTTEALYLATTQYEYQVLAADALFYDPEHTTAIHKFVLTEDGVDYAASGEVRGHLGWAEDKRSFRMGAGGDSGEYLNVVTSIGSTWNDTSSTRLTVLKEDGDELESIDFIDGIGKPGEQLFAARFVGDRAYLVTFRVIDPLYVVDLSDQDEPVITGELEIEGYSDYLHPVGENLLLGFGKDAIPDDGSSDFGFARGAWYQGVKVSLFDVSDPESPEEINALVYGKRGSESEVLTDHHGISFLPATAASPFRFAIPIQVNETEPNYEGFDPDAPSSWYSFTNKGLYLFEVTDTGVTETGYVEGDSTEELGVFVPFFNTFGDRSVLVNDAVFYVHEGEVRTAVFGSAP
ncbi:MAG: beta-propeller domain-containing protein [Pseudomonadales bacterium]|nr:beta-propeller domain-containing protein [Pseudomonadales bacterium]